MKRRITKQCEYEENLMALCVSILLCVPPERAFKILGYKDYFKRDSAKRVKSDEDLEIIKKIIKIKQKYPDVTYKKILNLMHIDISPNTMAKRIERFKEKYAINS